MLTDIEAEGGVPRQPPPRPSAAECARSRPEPPFRHIAFLPSPDRCLAGIDTSHDLRRAAAPLRQQQICAARRASAGLFTKVAALCSWLYHSNGCHDACGCRCPTCVNSLDGFRHFVGPRPPAPVEIHQARHVQVRSADAIAVAPHHRLCQTLHADRLHMATPARCSGIDISVTSAPRSARRVAASRTLVFTSASALGCWNPSVTMPIRMPFTPPSSMLA